MKKIFVCSFLVISAFLLVVSFFALASAQENSSETSPDGLQDPQISGNQVGGEINEEIFDSDVGSEAVAYIEKFVEKRGISADSIINVSKVDFNNLPKEVNIENVNDANLVIYQVNYDEESEEKKLFIVTYSLEKLRAQGDLIVSHDKREFLNFGFRGVMTESGFLQTATGIEGSLEKGYVMMRRGSITALSTNLEIAKEGPGIIEIIIYKNGEPVWFRNTITASEPGIKKDYDIQSKDTILFYPGDVISVYANINGDVALADAITLVEITTD